MRLFPAFFLMEGAHIVVFGGGEEARRKVRLIAKTPARITVITDKVVRAFSEEFTGRVTFAPVAMGGQALDTATFAIVAIEDDSAAMAAISLARQYGVSVNAVDRKDQCDFVVPSMLDRGDIVAAIGTGGAAPVLAKSIRAKLEMLLPPQIGDLAAFARDLRPAVMAALPEGPARRQFWEAALNGAVAERVLAGDRVGGERLAHELLAGGAQDGVVHIVGAGPGDPDLLTVKALRLIQNADIVYYDRLVSAEIMDLVRRDADRVAVGKCKGHHLVPQSQIHSLLIDAAQAGKRVVRLKGGDPFIFGRGGEELEALKAAGVEAHVVPGITSALGCAASAGLPLTHRDHAQTLIFVTGHAKAGGMPDVDWSILAREGQTVVIFMGVGTAVQIAKELMAAGRAPKTPVGVIENGTRANEVRTYGALVELPTLIEKANIKGPALLIIGDVAAIPAEALAKYQVETAA